MNDKLTCFKLNWYDGDYAVPSTPHRRKLPYIARITVWFLRSSMDMA